MVCAAPVNGVLWEFQVEGPVQEAAVRYRWSGGSFRPFSVLRYSALSRLNSEIRRIAVLGYTPMVKAYKFAAKPAAQKIRLIR